MAGRTPNQIAPEKQNHESNPWLENLRIVRHMRRPDRGVHHGPVIGRHDGQGDHRHDRIHQSRVSFVSSHALIFPRGWTLISFWLIGSRLTYAAPLFSISTRSP